MASVHLDHGVAHGAPPDGRRPRSCAQPPHGALLHSQGTLHGVTRAQAERHAARQACGVCLDRGRCIWSGETRVQVNSPCQHHTTPALKLSQRAPTKQQKEQRNAAIRPAAVLKVINILSLSAIDAHLALARRHSADCRCLCSAGRPATPPPALRDCMPTCAPPHPPHRAPRATALNTHPLDEQARAPRHLNPGPCIHAHL